MYSSGQSECAGGGPSVGCVSEATVGEHPVACSEGVPAIPNIGVRFLGRAGVLADTGWYERTSIGMRGLHLACAGSTVA